MRPIQAYQNGLYKSFGQISQAKATFGTKQVPEKKYRVNWLSLLSVVFGISSLIFSISVQNELYAFKGEVRTETISASEKFEDSELTLKRVGTILSYLISDKENLGKLSAIEASQADSFIESLGKIQPRTVITSSKSAIKKSPSEKSETLMIVSKDSKLIVSDSQDDWFQVTAPTGEKGWVSEKQITLEGTGNG